MIDQENGELEKIKTRTLANRLSLNVDKTYMILFWNGCHATTDEREVLFSGGSIVWIFFGC